MCTLELEGDFVASIALFPDTTHIRLMGRVQGHFVKFCMHLTLAFSQASS